MQTTDCGQRPPGGLHHCLPQWEPEDVDSIMEKLSLPTEIVTSPVLEDENFMIEKEQLV